ncbi:MAG: hypothetical protein Q7V05_00590 [Methanoregula sp.]|nr:hypothetical protein [Methanoregula sp.]
MPTTYWKPHPLGWGDNNSPDIVTGLEGLPSVAIGRPVEEVYF